MSAALSNFERDCDAGLCPAHWENRGKHHPGYRHYCAQSFLHGKRCKCACGQERK